MKKKINEKFLLALCKINFTSFVVFQLIFLVYQRIADDNPLGPPKMLQVETLVQSTNKYLLNIPFTT